MRMLRLYCWLCMAVYGGRRPSRRKLTAALLTAGLCLSMAGQLFLLWQDNLLSLQTGLPLHLCGMMALLSLPLIWFGPESLYGLSLYLGMPCAFLALCFPAVIPASRPELMEDHFLRLHGLILCAGLFVMAQKKPLPKSGKTAFLLGSGYMLLIWRINPLINSNFLFLRSAPAGTPLVWLTGRGEGYYLCSYLLIAMTLIRWMEDFWKPLFGLLIISGNRSACNLCDRRSLPCTSRRRGSGY